MPQTCMTTTCCITQGLPPSNNIEYSSLFSTLFLTRCSDHHINLFRHRINCFIYVSISIYLSIALLEKLNIVCLILSENSAKVSAKVIFREMTSSRRHTLTRMKKFLIRFRSGLRGDMLKTFTLAWSNVFSANSEFCRGQLSISKRSPREFELFPIPSIKSLLWTMSEMLWNALTMLWKSSVQNITYKEHHYDHGSCPP